MIALQLTSLKQFMNHLLVADSFDSFLLQEAVIQTANTYTIDGRVNRDFYSEEEQASGQVEAFEFSPWANVKGVCFQLIKGKRTPLSFKFVFQLKPEPAARLLAQKGFDIAASQVKALVMTVRYDGSKAIVTTGCAYNTFVLSKEPEILWDRALCAFFRGKDIPHEEL